MNLRLSELSSEAWKILTNLSAKRETITYGALGKLLGLIPLRVNNVLGPIQEFCLKQGLPPLTILAADRNGVHGKGFVGYRRDEIEIGYRMVWNHTWEDEENPFGFVKSGQSLDSIVQAVANDPESAEEIYALVKVRGMVQQAFAAAVKLAYVERCAFTGMTFLGVGDAAHIVPWSFATNQQRLDVRNGLWLNPFHHRLFDRHFFAVNDQLKLEYCDSEPSEEYNEREASMSLALHKQKLFLPEHVVSKPLVAYFQQRAQLVADNFI